MVEILQATTPTFIITVPNYIDLSTVDNLCFSLKQNNNVLIHKYMDSLAVDGQTVSVFLTQLDTLQLSAGQATIQLNWLYGDGTRGGTREEVITVLDNLLKEVMT
jgi:hypothetical protein